MIWLIGFLTFILIVDCLLLILLVLVQLPKKEAGLGQAFGASATDALFGAGSGNALTKMTKYATAFFFILTLSLSILNAQQSKARRSQFERDLQKAGKQADVPVRSAPPLANTNLAPQTASTQTTSAGLLSTTNTVTPPTTNAAPSVPATNAVDKK